MKKVLTIVAVLLMAGMMSCDKVKDDGNGFYNNVVPESTSDKIVLLEDYTGVRCINCPAAGQTALELQSLYGHKLIVLSVHAGFLAMPLTGYPDFRTDAGTAWYEGFGFNSNPIGTINRVKKDGGWGIQDGEWGTAVAAALQEEAVAKLDITNNYNIDTRNLDITVNTEFLSELTGNFMVTVCLMEDSIVGRQAFPENEGGVQENYMHRHVMRGAVNGTWGEQIHEGTIKENDKFTTTCSITLNEDFNEDQCYVIAYVYDENQDKLILQAGEKKVK